MRRKHQTLWATVCLLAACGCSDSTEALRVTTTIDAGAEPDAAAEMVSWVAVNEARTEPAPPIDFSRHTWLPRSMTCDEAEAMIHYPDVDWTFEKPEPSHELEPFTAADVTRRLGSASAGGVTSPARHLGASAPSYGLWLAPGEDVVIHFGIQPKPDSSPDGGAISITTLVDWKEVPEARFQLWDADRTEVEFEATGTGAVLPMDERVEIFDVIIPASHFTESRSYELAIAIAARGTTSRRLYSKPRRFIVYANGAQRLPHPCVPPAAPPTLLSEIFDLERYSSYIAGFRSGILYPQAIDWDLLPDIQSAAQKDEVTFEYFFLDLPKHRTVAFVPIVNGLPVADVIFGETGDGVGPSATLLGEFRATMPDADVADVWVPLWPDPYYPPQDRFQQRMYLPPGDTNGNAGDGIRGSSITGSNILRYHIESD